LARPSAQSFGGKGGYEKPAGFVGRRAWGGHPVLIEQHTPFPAHPPARKTHQRPLGGRPGVSHAVAMGARDFAFMTPAGQSLAFRHPAARAASSEQNQRSPLNQIIFIAE
jgi:hypothetical protein